MSTAQRYVDAVVGRDAFLRWPSHRIHAETKKWRVRRTSSYLVLSASGGGGLARFAVRRIGADERRDGVLAWIRVPPLRNWDAASEARTALQGARSLADRCERIVAFANARRLDWAVSPDAALILKERNVFVPKRNVIS